MPQLLANIDVSDLRTATDFYCGGLGLTLGRRLGDRCVELLGASVPIYLLENPPDSSPAPTVPQGRDYSRHWTPVHLDFVVPDVEAAVRKAQAAGATLEGAPRTHDWGRIAVLADPFGNGFCLLQFLGRGYDEIAQREP